MDSKIIALLACLFFTGCTAGQGYSAASAQATAADDKSEQKASTTKLLPAASPPLFVVFTNKCPKSGEGSTEAIALPLIAGTVLKSLAETVIPSTVGWLYDKGTDYLERQHTKLLSSSTATNTTRYYASDTATSSFGCIVIARAERGTNISPKYAHSRHGAMNIAPSSSWGQGPSKHEREELTMSNAPEFYFELGLSSYNANVVKKQENSASDKGRLATAADPQSLPKVALYREVKPARLDYFDTGAESRGKDQAKYVSLEVNMEAMDDKREWRQIFSKTYDFGLLKIGTGDIPVQSLGADVFIPPFFADKDRAYIDPVPVRITAILTETENGADLARVVALSLRDAQTRKATVTAVSDSVTGQINAAIDARLGKAAASAGKPGTSAAK